MSNVIKFKTGLGLSQTPPTVGPYLNQGIKKGNKAGVKLSGIVC